MGKMLLQPSQMWAMGGVVLGTLKYKRKFCKSSLQLMFSPLVSHPFHNHNLLEWIKNFPKRRKI
jgi:hypothetical protein